MATASETASATGPSPLPSTIPRRGATEPARRRTVTLGELLPLAFGPGNLT